LRVSASITLRSFSWPAAKALARSARRSVVSSLCAELADEGQVQLLQGLAGGGLLGVEAVAQVVHLAGHQVDDAVAGGGGGGLDVPQQAQLLLGELAPAAETAELKHQPAAARG
jgi:hypothetical protein